MDAALDLSSPSIALSLPHIRTQLIRLEDTVLFHLIERAQFPLSQTIYTPAALPLPNTNLSFSDWVLRETEVLHSRIRRYQSPDEHPFFPDAVQPLILPPLRYPELLWANDVNVNRALKAAYAGKVVPTICARATRAERSQDAQENYGSAATADVQCLQALSRRVHFGKFVAEAKFRADPPPFVAMIKNADAEGIDEAITDRRVEELVLERVRRKAEMYGVDPEFKDDEAVAARKIHVDAVVAVYRDVVIPLTKVVEVEYLMQRLRGTEWE